ncbi:MAG: efflux RND transporter permease subunit [Myxococcota bacterium]
MQLVDFSLRRRVTVAMCAVAMVLFGLVAFSRLKISLLPDLSYPSLTIETSMPGAAPAEIEQLLSRPIEERVGVVSGVERITSLSTPGQSSVTVEFGWGRSMDFAAIDVREKLDVLRLPDGSEPPILRRYDPSADPIIRLYLTTDGAAELDLLTLRQLAEERVEKDLESTEGVAAIDVRGGLQPEIEIEIDPGRLSLTGQTLAQVTEALRKANIDQAGGSLYEREARYLVRARNRFGSIADIEATVLFDEDGKRVTVGDVATVRRTHRQRESVTRLGGLEAVELALFQEGDANTTAVARSVRARLEPVRERLPEGVVLVVAADQSTFIEASVDEVLQGAVLGGVFAVVVLLLFLRDVRSTAIIAVSIPVSVVATFFLMYQTGTTLNVMSLGGLALGVGMLVDSAIVVLEAIHRHREQGATALEAARTGASEVGRAVVASTLTTVAVFLPVVFLEGMAAQLFGDMAVTVCFSLVVSLAVSLTLIPMISALGGTESAVEQPPPGRFIRVLLFPVASFRLGVETIATGVGWLLRPVTHLFNAGFERLAAAYPAVCRLSVRRPATVIGIAVLAFAATVASVPRLGLDLIPSLSQGEFGFAVELPTGTPLSRTDAVVREAQQAVLGDPRIDRISSVAGASAVSGSAGTTGGEHTAALSVRMVADTTPEDEAAVIDRLRQALREAGAQRARLTRPAVFSLRRPVELHVFAEDLGELRDHAERLRTDIATIAGVVEARSSADFGNPEVQVRFDHEAIAQLDLRVADVAASVRAQLQGDVTTRFRQGHRDVDIRVRALPRQQATPADLRNLIVATRDGAPIVLDAVADVELGTGPSEIRRLDQSRAAVVSADVSGRDMGAVAADVTAAAESARARGVRVELAGQEQEMFQSLRSLLMATALAGFLVYVVMASQFESLLHPFIVIFTLPLGAIGVVGSLLLTGSSMSVISMVGVVMLAGIVVNNAIVLVDAINQRRAEGMPKAAAIVAAGRDRLRPILMTSATTILGLLPLALAQGPGAELRRALAIAVIGGLVVATALTLIVIPAVYRLVDRKRYAEPKA